MIAIIQPYNPAWKLQFEQLKQVLATVLKDVTIDIQHVGSTAVPRLNAKPILDIDIIIDNVNQLEAIREQLQQVGYLYKGDQGIPDRFAFRQSSTQTPLTDIIRHWQEHHLYVCIANSVAVQNHIVFRDALLQNQQLVEQYNQLKLNLVQQSGMTRALYNTSKTAFIIAVLQDAGLDHQAITAITLANTNI